MHRARYTVSITLNASAVPLVLVDFPLSHTQHRQLSLHYHLPSLDSLPRDVPIYHTPAESLPQQPIRRATRPVVVAAPLVGDGGDGWIASLLIFVVRDSASPLVNFCVVFVIYILASCFRSVSHVHRFRWSSPFYSRFVGVHCLLLPWLIAFLHLPFLDPNHLRFGLNLRFGPWVGPVFLDCGVAQPHSRNKASIFIRTVHRVFQSVYPLSFCSSTS